MKLSSICKVIINARQNSQKFGNFTRLHTCTMLTPHQPARMHTKLETRKRAVLEQLGHTRCRVLSDFNLYRLKATARNLTFTMVDVHVKSHQQAQRKKFGIHCSLEPSQLFRLNLLFVQMPTSVAGQLDSVRELFVWEW